VQHGNTGSIMLAARKEDRGRHLHMQELIKPKQMREQFDLNPGNT